ncbi:protein kinase, putative [Bodo saltans]|uniref:Protein kinase, putative n=1 Tax=Bodo saltans TaxID=75058 RepID=A0A0S4KKM0_BODSA|nr:protein kinase, putative [Bodo saltans]|eukprot:CUI13475.1 protein kinase, putative [Bodo saltans]
MEYVSGGSLLAMLQQFGPLPLEATKRYVIDILKGLRYLHDHHVTHCDIKPHNALLANDGTCKLSDFGSSVNNQVRAKEQQEQEEAAAAGHQETMPPNDEQLLVRGTSWYLSPEAAKGEIRPSNDIWSLGITLIEMLTGKVPWTYRGSEANFIIMLGKDETMVPPLGPELPEEAKVFVRLCFERDPEKRPTAQLLLQHPFLT